MTSEKFCYWLQGYFELSEDEILTAGQIKIIKEHLEMVFKAPAAYPYPPSTVTEYLKSPNLPLTVTC